MEFQKDIAPPTVPAEPTTAAPPAVESDEPSAFKKALQAVEAHRDKVRMAIGVALVARLLFEFKFVALLKSSGNLTVQIPYIGLAMLSYLLVLMWLAARTRDRFGFGMALGIGVIEATYLLVTGAMVRPWTVMSAGPMFLVALAHVPMAFFAMKSATAYPPQDTKQPWIVGFITALVFLTIPWIAPAIVETLMGQ